MGGLDRQVVSTSVDRSGYLVAQVVAKPCGIGAPQHGHFSGRLLFSISTGQIRRGDRAEKRYDANHVDSRNPHSAQTLPKALVALCR
jgi:hypothetical protein